MLQVKAASNVITHACKGKTRRRRKLTPREIGLLMAGARHNGENFTMGGGLSFQCARISAGA